MAKQHCNGVHICLVGTNCFQNGLFVSTLKKNHHCQCAFVVVDTFSEIPADVLNKPDHKVLVYLDCFDLRAAQIEALLTEHSQETLSGSLLALFNLAEATDFELKGLSLGVRGFFYPNNTPADFCRGIRAILNGEIWLSRKKLSKVVLNGFAEELPRCPRSMPGTVNLTPREKDVLTLLATGASNEVIAAELYVSSHTIRTHLYNIYRKINVKNRMQASLWTLNHLQ